jgi:CRP-like cAMP-binding protein
VATTLAINNLQESSLKVLSGVPLFSGLNPAEHRTAIEISELIKYEGDEIIFSEGDHSDGLNVVLAGGVAISTLAEGDVNRLKSGDIFGELGLFCHVLRTATAKAGGAGAIILHIKDSHLQEILPIDPRVYSTIMRNVAVYLAEKIIKLTPPD